MENQIGQGLGSTENNYFCWLSETNFKRLISASGTLFRKYLEKNLKHENGVTGKVLSTQNSSQIFLALLWHSSMPLEHIINSSQEKYVKS